MTGAHFRHATQADIAEMRILWKLCFPEDDELYIQRFFSAMPVEYALLACKGDILAMLFLLPAEVAFGDRALPVRYLYAGCTHPSYRRHGIYGDLLRYAAEQVATMREFAIYLHPATEPLIAYYERHGYRPGIGMWHKTGDKAAVLPLTELTAAEYLTKRNALLPNSIPVWRLKAPSDRFFLDELLSDGWRALGDDRSCCLLSSDGGYAYDCLGCSPAADSTGCADGEYTDTAWWLPAAPSSLTDYMTSGASYTAFLGDF